ncbi:hypothetical protein D6817_04325 [Candidatus Pacearchaeota archaeon]|nr:MAG: hypothetical protein D6817_04325 [Candidatus Pacearchaeota archaeon]
MQKICLYLYAIFCLGNWREKRASLRRRSWCELKELLPQNSHSKLEKVLDCEQGGRLMVRASPKARRAVSSLH